MRPSSRRDVTLATLVAVVTLTFFVITLRPDVGGTEDSPKFQFVGQALGTAHSPGYPFYVMATYAFGRLPIGTLAYRINLFSAVCGALTCMCIFLTARRLGVTRLLSVAAALAAATSYPVWSNSVTAEVYTLAAVLSGLAVYWLIAFAQTGAVVAALRRVRDVGVRVRQSPDDRRHPAGGRHLRRRQGSIGAAAARRDHRRHHRHHRRGAVRFIAIRTMQGAPYLEARATTIMGVFDVIIARDVSWARFYQAQSAVAAIEVPMLLNGMRVHMGTIPIVARRGRDRRSASGGSNAEVLLIFGAAAGTLGMIANLWGDVVGFITPVCVQLWPLAALGVQMAGHDCGRQQPNGADRGGRRSRCSLPVINFDQQSSRRSRRCARRVKAPVCARCTRSCRRDRRSSPKITGWRGSINYMHFSGEVAPDPNPRVLDSDANNVRTAVADGLEVYAFEGATHWLNAQGLRFEKTDIARQPFESWLAAQPRGTLIVAASAGRPLPLEWLPAASRAQSGRRANYGAFAWTVGEPSAIVDQQDSAARVERDRRRRPLDDHVDDEGPADHVGRRRAASRSIAASRSPRSLRRDS